MLVFVHFDDGGETFLEGVAVGGETDDREDNGGRGAVADAEEFGHEAGVDIVAGCRTCVAGQDGEGGAGDS